MFGFLNVYKPKGITSHDVVSALRRVTKIKQIGHTGTLDPFAEGVLPICIGKATRLIEYLKDDKAYIGTVKLGKSTTTYDTEGETVNTSDKSVALDEIESVLDIFLGDIEQIPPMYSAIKVKGKKLYEYARKGESVDIQPRKVHISKLDILNFNSETKELELYIECSKGTYIRTLGEDIAEKLGSVGHLTKLTRVEIGPYSLKDAKKSSEVTIDDLIPISKMLSHLKSFEVEGELAKKALNGMHFRLPINDDKILLKDKDGIIALYKRENNGVYSCVRGLR